MKYKEPEEKLGPCRMIWS